MLLPRDAFAAKNEASTPRGVFCAEYVAERKCFKSRDDIADAFRRKTRNAWPAAIKSVRLLRFV
jgi:hypothetical protein